MLLWHLIFDDGDHDDHHHHDGDDNEDDDHRFFAIPALSRPVLSSTVTCNHHLRGEITLGGDDVARAGKLKNIIFFV